MLSTVTASYADIARFLGLDVVAVLLLVWGFFLPRHGRSDLALVYTAFNLALFAVLVTITREQVSAAVGFGLFGVLSIIRLRSEPFTNTELAYFFAILALALLNGIGSQDAALTALLDVLVLTAIVVAELATTPTTTRRVTLAVATTDEDELRRRLAALVPEPIRGVSVLEVDELRESMLVDVRIERSARAPRAARERAARA